MPSGIACPKCGSGDLIKVGAMKGRRPFWGCSNYATTQCDYRLYTSPVKEPCPKCASPFLVVGGTKAERVVKCPNEKCDFSRPLEAQGDDGEAELNAPRGRGRAAGPEATA